METEEEVSYNPILLGFYILSAFSLTNVLLIWTSRRIRMSGCCWDCNNIRGYLWLPEAVKNALHTCIGYTITANDDDDEKDDDDNNLFVEATVKETKKQQHDIEFGYNKDEEDDDSGTVESTEVGDYEIRTPDEIKRQDILNRFNQKHDQATKFDAFEEEPNNLLLEPPNKEPEHPTTAPHHQSEEKALDQLVLDTLSGLGGDNPHRETTPTEEREEPEDTEKGIKEATQEELVTTGKTKKQHDFLHPDIVFGFNKDKGKDNDRGAEESTELTFKEITIPKVTLDYERGLLDENRRKDILNRNSQQQLCRQGSVASLASKFEEFQDEESNNKQRRSCPLVEGGPGSGTQQATMLKRASSFTVRSKDEEEQPRHCSMCNKKFFPTDKTFTARKRVYHIGCYRCTICGTKMINHPKEVHTPSDDSGKHTMILQCRQCVLDNLYKDIEHARGRAAGESITISANEQGDIDSVVEAIGDDLEEAMWGMIPKCSTCGGDFLSYNGQMHIVGSCKYHHECFLYGKPMNAGDASGGPSITLDPVQGSKNLPETFILKLSNTATGKLITTLFFVWKGKEEAIKSLRAKRLPPSSVSATFVLDEKAPANPNFDGRKKKKTTAPLPSPSDDDHGGDLLTLSLVGADELAPKQIHPVTIMTNNSILVGAIGYTKYTLNHTLKLTIPCTTSCGDDDDHGHVLNLLGATLMVNIQKQQQQSSEGVADKPPIIDQ